jgi:hypothetical protein
MSTSSLRSPLLPLVLTFLLSAVAAACAGDAPHAIPTAPTADAGSDAAAVMLCPVVPAAVDPSALVDDFEHGGAGAPLIAGRSGAWYASHDATSDGIMVPDGLAAPEAIPGGRCGSRQALHITGSGFNDWGAVVALALHAAPNAAGVYEETPYDARARNYQGVSFFARVGETSVNTVRYAVSDQFARPEAGLCQIASNNCYSTYGIPLGSDLGTQWREFRIPWSGLSQLDFGVKGSDTGPDTTKIYDIQFTFPPHVVFDFWVDDMRFF